MSPHFTAGNTGPLWCQVPTVQVAVVGDGGLLRHIGIAQRNCRVADPDLLLVLIGAEGRLQEDDQHADKPGQDNAPEPDPAPCSGKPNDHREACGVLHEPPDRQNPSTTRLLPGRAGVQPPPEVASAVDELPFGIRRITTPLPTRPGHVHSYLLPGEDGWTLVDTGIGLSERAGGLARVARRRRGGADLRHPLPSRPRRRRRRRRRADAGARAPGRARLRAVRARLGEPELARADRRVVPHPRRPERDHRGADRLGRRLPAVHPLPARPDPRRRRRPARRLGAGRRTRPRRRAAVPAQGARSSSRPTTCSAGSRRRSGSGRPAGPIRSATSSSRSSGRSSSRPSSRSPATATRSPTPSAAPAS